jgi:hypothetical protein
MSRRQRLQFRAVCYDRQTETDPDPSGYEFGQVSADLQAAQAQLSEMMREANPTFDEGWIEVRRIGPWKRVEALGRVVGKES